MLTKFDTEALKVVAGTVSGKEVRAVVVFDGNAVYSVADESQ